MVSGKTIAIATAITAAVAGVSYVAYFDYRRRNDRQFRRKLKRDRKKAEKTAQKVSSMSLDDISDQALELLNIVAKEKLPDSADDKETYFLSQVSKGEALCGAGPAGYTEAACRFFQALKVYPNPVELVMIYQRTTPDEVFKLIMAMMAQEVRQKQLRYFEVFPPESKNVSIKDKSKLDAKAKAKSEQSSKEGEEAAEVVVPNRSLFVNKSFEAGEVVYEEEAVVSTLLPCARNGQFCYHCLMLIPGATASQSQNDLKKAESHTDAEAAEGAVSSETDDKQADDKQESEEPASEEPHADDKTAAEAPATKADDKLEEGNEESEPLAPEEPIAEVKASEADVAPEVSSKGNNALACDKCHEAVYCTEKCRQDAYDAYHQFLCPGSSGSAAREFAALTQQSHELAPILIAKFFGVLVDREKKKELAQALGIAGATTEADEYTTWEHLESMRYLELIPTPSDAQILRKLSELMSQSVPGLSQFVTGERYTMLKGKLDYNAYAVHSGEGVEVPAESESTRVSDTMRDDHSGNAVGIALYLISSHLAHSCDPNAQAVFPENTDKIAIKALRPIAKGEEVRISFVNPSLGKEARQQQLKGSYRLSCTCSKCESEAGEKDVGDEAAVEAESLAEQSAEEHQEAEKGEEEDEEENEESENED